ncbi:MAG: hypothetical protein EA352_05060 [Gemmatimonadales bacterium]|nr:MAG: hypothetical protein EA352_05060 [Gemmatimonadales bacterium]
MTSDKRIRGRPKGCLRSRRLPGMPRTPHPSLLPPSPFAGGLALLAALLLLVPAGLRAQDVEERFPGVSLGITYDGRAAQTLAIQPFSGPEALASTGRRAEAIVSRDLRYSNQFQVVDSLPSSLARADESVDYAVWDQLGADLLVTGRMERGTGGQAVLMVELHDIVYREVVDRGRFPVPDPDSAEFRMAVHLASDAVVEWATGEPGIAATRIVFVRRMEDGSQDLWVVDSDGENLRRMHRQSAAEGGHPIATSPVWAPDGRRVAFVSYRSGLPRIYELDLDSGEERMVPSPRTGDYITPTYTPDGETLTFAITGGGRSGLFSYNIRQDCCFRNLTEGRHEDLSPTWSPDGRRLAFNSNRLGVGAPQVYVMDRDGGRPELLSPFRYDRPGYYTSPDWSPRGDRVAYHGRVERRGEHQILVSELGRGNRVARLTSEGVNEDPSWAPDGRHLVFVGRRNWGRGLFIVDAATGQTRTLVSGMDVRYPSWSPSFQTILAEDR